MDQQHTNGSQTICVYASSSDALDTPFFAAAERLGTLIGERGHTLVYGGGNVGLMGALARAVHRSGGQVIGVIPEALLAQNYEAADRTIVTADLRERKAVMETQADAFIGLPGGFGTLEEVLEILTLKQLKFHNKPIVLLNTERFYDQLIAVFEHIYERKFARLEYRRLYHLAPDAADALTYIDQYAPDDLPGKWF